MKILIENISRKLKTLKEKRRLKRQYGVIKLKTQHYKTVDTTVNMDLFGES